MKKKIKKSLSTILLVCCIFSSQIRTKSTVAALDVKNIVFIGTSDVQKEDFIKQLCSINRSENDEVKFSINVMYNNEPIILNIFNMNSFESYGFKSNFETYYSNSNLLVLTYNANKVHSEERFRNILELGYENVKDSYRGKMVVLGLKWNSDSEDQFDTYSLDNATTERIAKEVFGEKKFAFSTVISKDVFANYNICNFINSLCRFTRELKSRLIFSYNYSSQDDNLIMRKSKSLTFPRLISVV